MVNHKQDDWLCYAGIAYGVHIETFMGLFLAFGRYPELLMQGKSCRSNNIYA
jgi:hypothetical protein